MSQRNLLKKANLLISKNQAVAREVLLVKKIIVSLSWMMIFFSS